MTELTEPEREGIWKRLLHGGLAFTKAEWAYVMDEAGRPSRELGPCMRCGSDNPCDGDWGLVYASEYVGRLCEGCLYELELDVPCPYHYQKKADDIAFRDRPIECYDWHDIHTTCPTAASSVVVSASVRCLV